MLRSLSCVDLARGRAARVSAMTAAQQSHSPAVLRHCPAAPMSSALVILPRASAPLTLQPVRPSSSMVSITHAS